MQRVENLLTLLPSELIESILRLLTPREFKLLRLTSKSTNELVTPRLFSFFRLYPHIRSYDRLEAISKSPHLVPHLRRIQYCMQYAGLPDHLLKRLKSVWSKDIGEVEKQRLIDRVREFKQETLLVANFNDYHIHVVRLNRIFSRLIALENVSVDDLGDGRTICEHDKELDYHFSRARENEGFGTLVLGLPPFYQQMADQTTQLHEHTRLERYSGFFRPSGMRAITMSILLSCSSLPKVGQLRHFEANRTSWPQLLSNDYGSTGDTFGKLEPTLKDTFSHLKSFSVTPEILDESNADGSAEVMGWAVDNRLMTDLQYLLSLMQNLEKLNLVFREIDLPIERITEEEVQDWNSQRVMTGFQSYFSARPSRSYQRQRFIARNQVVSGPGHDLEVPAPLTRLTWSDKLVNLSLTGLRCNSVQLRAILRHCSNTLKSLTLAQTCIMNDVLRKPGLTSLSIPPKLCLVRVLKYLRSDLKLTDIRLSGFMSNGGFQYWCFNDEYNDQFSTLANRPVGKREPDVTWDPITRRDLAANGDPKDGTIYERVCAWITHQPGHDECPIQHLAVPKGWIDLFVQSEQEGRRVPKELSIGPEEDGLLNPEYEGDISWGMFYCEVPEDIDEILISGDEDLTDSEADDEDIVDWQTLNLWNSLEDDNVLANFDFDSFLNQQL